MPARFNLNLLRLCNRINVGSRDEDIRELEAMALKTDMPYQAFLADVIHKYVTGKFDKKLTDGSFHLCLN